MEAIETVAIAWTLRPTQGGRTAKSVQEDITGAGAVNSNLVDEGKSPRRAVGGNAYESDEGSAAAARHAQGHVNTAQSQVII